MHTVCLLHPQTPKHGSKILFSIRGWLVESVSTKPGDTELFIFIEKKKGCVEVGLCSLNLCY